MEKLLFINACIRGEDSRTLGIAKPILETLKKRYEVDEIDLSHSTLTPVTAELFYKRGTVGLSDEDIKNATLVANADRIVIACPFWDMGIPSVLKVFIEHSSAPGITFKNNEDNSTYGCCKADKILYITTRGMDINTDDPLDQGTPYLRAVAWLWGISEVITVSACGMDVCESETVSTRLDKALKDGLTLCESF